MTALYYDLKQRLTQKFGDEFPSHGDEAVAPSTGPSAQPPPRKYVTPLAPDENLDEYLASGPQTAEERLEKQKKIERQRLKRSDMLIMKNSDLNVVDSNRPDMFIREGKRFSDKFGDRTVILMWGYEADRKLWRVRRKSLNTEYYKYKSKFMS